MKNKLLFSVALVAALVFTSGSFAYTWVSGETSIDIIEPTGNVSTVNSTSTQPDWNSIMPVPPDWLYRKQITIDHTKVEDNLTDFSVLISITDSDLMNDALDSGYDIKFTQSDGSTQLDHEIEKFDGDTGELAAWVRIPSLSSSTDTIIYMYYGNSGATDQQNITGVWNTGFEMVQHMVDTTTSTITDSTSNDHDGTKGSANNPLESANGKIAEAQDFSSDRISCGDLGIGANYTAECWIKADTLTGSGDYDTYGFTMMASAVSGQGYPLWLTARGTEVRFWAYESTASTGGWRETSGAGLDTTNKFYIAAIATSGSTSKVYVNGVEKLSFTNDADVTWTNIFTLGDLRPDRAIYFDGIIDEVRISSEIRTAEWIETSYNNQNAPATFYGVGIEEDMSGLICGEVPTGNLFNIVPDVDYTGDLLAKFYLTNTANLTRAYSYLNMKLYMAGSVEAGETPNYALLTLQNGEASLNFSDLVPVSDDWTQTSQGDFQGGTLNQVVAVSPGDVLLDDYADSENDTYNDETKIASSANVTVSGGQVKISAGAGGGSETLRPNAAGDDTSITIQYPATGAHYDKVDDVTSDDWSTYVSTNSNSYQRDLYNMPASTGSGSISDVTAYFRFAMTSDVGDVGIWQDTNNTHTIGAQGVWTDVPFNSEVRSDGSYNHTADTTTDLTADGWYLIMYEVRSTSTSNTRHGIMSQITLEGTAVEGSEGHGYSRNDNNDEAYTGGACIVNASADDTVVVQWRPYGVASSDVLSNSKTSLCIVRLPDSANVAYLKYTDDSDNGAYSGTTWSGNEVTWADQVYETDNTVIQKSAVNDYTFTLKKVARYLVKYDVTFTSGASSRTQRIARATLAGSAVPQSYSYCYMRNSTATPNTLHAVFIVDNTIANQDLIIQAQRGAADIDSTVTRTVSSSSIEIVELPSSAETVITYDSSGGQDVGTTQTLNWARDEVQRNAAAFTLPTVTTVEVEQDDDYLFLGNGLAEDPNKTTGTRLTFAGDWFVGAVENDIGGHGNYLRGAQGSQDTWQASLNAHAVLELNADDQVTFRTELEGDAGDVDNTLADQCGFSALRIGSLVGNAYARAVVKSGTTVDQGTEESTGSDTFVLKSKQWTTNPATGQPWTWSEIDALQVGVELKADTSDVTSACTQVYIEVNYSTYYTNGTVTSINLLNGDTVYTVDNFDYNVSAIPSGTGLQVQFSQDDTNWYNSSGVLDGWDTMSAGAHTIDLSTLSWSGPNLYYHMLFTSDGGSTPVLDDITADFTTLYTSGDLTSSAFDTGDDLDWNWLTIYFTINEPAATDIQFQLRTAATQAGLSSATWYGPTSTSDFYTESVTAINPVHDGDRWIQYKAYFSGPGDSTPTLSDATITYTSAELSYTVEIIGGGYCLVSDNTSEWGTGWTLTPQIYCEIAYR